MARSFSNAKRLSSFFGDRLSVVVSRHGFAAAAYGGESETAMVKKGGEELSKSVPRVSDPAVTVYQKPEFRLNQVHSFMNFIRPFSPQLNAYKSQMPSMFSVSNKFSAQSTQSATVPLASHARPLSPHLSIYKPQSTSMFSISNRIAASFLSATVLLFYILCMKTGLICFTYYNFYQIFFGVAGFTELLCFSSIPLIILHLLHVLKH